jgi:hypothetical protein
MSDNYQYDVFLSYAHEDSTWCEMLADRLHKANVRVWFDRWQLRPGDHLLVKINEGLQNSRRMVAVWTSNYFRDSKLWTILEIFSRQHSDVLSVDRPLIPLMREACIVPPTLGNIISIDFIKDETFEDAFRSLIHSLDISITNKIKNSDLNNRRAKKTINAENHVLVNPYRSYSSGGIVVDPAMFFGRQELLEEIKNQMCHAPTRQTFPIYGQKRSGKSSLLYHLKLQISQPCLPVITSLGLLGVNTPNRQHSFIRLLLDDLRHALQDRVEIRLSRWPADTLISERPIDAFREGLWAAEEILLSIGWNEPRVIFLIDEFSYLFEYIKAGLIPRSIMKQWKRLQELGEFSAVLAGNDSMPRFIADFPNDFAMTTDVRLNYLTPTEMRRLADEPIRLNGKTRYRGNTLDRVWTLTGGSPYYTQIICAKLVDHINERKALLITDIDLDEVLAGLIVGQDRLTASNFDPLIPLIGASVTQLSQEVYLDVLSAIAKASDLHSGANQDDLPQCHNQAQIISDLMHYDVIFVDSTKRLQIRIGLFAEWLRHNS